MQFGLWFEPEMVNLDSDVARAHPEWMMAAGDRLPVESRYQQVINLGIPECYAYIRDAILAMLAEYDIGYIKWDHNRDLIEAGTQPTRPARRARADAGVLPAASTRSGPPTPAWRSSRAPPAAPGSTSACWSAPTGSGCRTASTRSSGSRCMRWTTQLIPPELMGSHIASGPLAHDRPRSTTSNFRAATAIFGHLGIEWDLRQGVATPSSPSWRTGSPSTRSTASCCSRGDLVRMDFPDDTLTATGVVSPDRSRAIYSYASVARSEVVLLGRVPIPGLDPPVATGSSRCCRMLPRPAAAAVVGNQGGLGRG